MINKATEYKAKSTVDMIYTTINVSVLPCEENNQNLTVVDDLPCVHVSKW